MFPKVLTGSGNGLVLIMQQAIIRANDNLVLQQHKASLGQNDYELSNQVSVSHL